MTHTTKHTPGPFEVVPHSYGYEIKRAHITPSCTTMGTIATIKPQGDRQLANAHLIAAAPAMYEALSHAAMSYHHPACKCKGEYSANPELYCTCHVQKARAALAQAEGKQ